MRTDDIIPQRESALMPHEQPAGGRALFTLLVIDHDAERRQRFVEFFHAQSCFVRETSTWEQGWSDVRYLAFDAVMVAVDGDEPIDDAFLASLEVLQRGRTVPIVAITDAKTEQAEQRAQQLRALTLSLATESLPALFMRVIEFLTAVDAGYIQPIDSVSVIPHASYGNGHSSHC